MLWRVVLQSFATLGKKWRELAQEYNTVITGQAREEPRWEQCMSSLTGSLGIALSSLYVRHNFKGDSKHIVSKTKSNSSIFFSCTLIRIYNYV
jgi:predicted metalloendopeptidase